MRTTVYRFLLRHNTQTALLAVAMASRPSVLLLDEATSGLDAEVRPYIFCDTLYVIIFMCNALALAFLLQAEKRVEDSVVEYAQKYRAVVLWVTHSQDIAERLLQE